MKLQQLRYLIAIEKNNLSISAAAEMLFTSQPGVSKQIRQLEEELGVKLFNRNGKQLTHITPEGRHIIARAKSIMREVDNIKGLAKEFRDDQIGTLKLATTHTPQTTPKATPRTVGRSMGTTRYARWTDRVVDGLASWKARDRALRPRRG